MLEKKSNKKIFYLAVFIWTALLFVFSVARAEAAFEDCDITPVAPFYQIKAPDGFVIAQIDSAGNMELNSPIKGNQSDITQSDSDWQGAYFVKNKTNMKKFVFHKNGILLAGKFYPRQTIATIGTENFAVKNNAGQAIAVFYGANGNIQLAGDVCYPIVEIDSCEELQLIGNNPAYPLSGVTYALTDNIDCSMTKPANQPADYDGPWKDSKGFMPIGSSSTPFYGNFSGRGFAISNLYINRSESNIGLFGYLAGSVNNLTISNAEITGLSNIGILAGNAGIDNSKIARIKDCSVSGSLSTVSPAEIIGGLIGYLAPYSVVSNSHADIRIEATGNYIGGFIGKSMGSIASSSAEGIMNVYEYMKVGDTQPSGGDVVGGFIGHMSCLSYGIVSNSFSNVGVYNKASYGSFTGGFVGNLECGTITQSYARGDVQSGNSSADTGGFVGGIYEKGKVIDCYSVSNILGDLERGWLYGGFVGYVFSSNSSIVNSYSVGKVFGAYQAGGFAGNGGGANSFWDTENSGNANCAGLDPISCVGNVSGKSSFLMKTKSTFNTVWDFDNIWKIPVEGKYYPCFKWQDDSTCFANEPIEINSCEELQMIGHPELMTFCGDKCDQAYYPLMKNYIIGNDIDCSLTDKANQPAEYSGLWLDGKGFNPIGEYVLTDTWQKNYLRSYKGYFEGNNKKISNLYIGRAGEDFVGIFSYSRGEVPANVKVKNLKLENIRVYGKDYVGGLFGSLQQIAEVDNVSVSGLVSGNIYVGGLVGYASSYGDFYTINKSNFSGQVIAVGNYAGGLWGFSEGFGKKIINNSYTTGSVVSNGGYLGGLVGKVYAVEINNSYSGSNITGNASGLGTSGGLVGWMEDSSGKSKINNSYSFGVVNNGFGFIGYYSTGTISNSYWDTSASGKTVACGGNACSGVTGLTTQQMKVESSYASTWLFQPPTTDNWKLNAITPAGSYYPCLSWQDNSTCSKAFLTISDCEQLQKIGYDLAYPLNGEYLVVPNIATNGGDFINCSMTNPSSPNFNPNGTWKDGKGFKPIGIGNNFTGIFNGNSKAIKGLYEKKEFPGTIVNASLFNGTSNAIIKNIGLEEIDLTGQAVGGIVLSLYNDSQLINSYASGNATSTLTAQSAGGLVGLNTNRSIISNCYSRVNVSGIMFVGGLAGYNTVDSKIYNSYSTGSVFGSDRTIGGLVGANIQSSKIFNSYSLGSVTGNSATGGLVGSNEALTSLIYYSYWNTETSGKTSGCGTGACAGATGLTTAQMKVQSNYAGFDFTTPIWKIPTDYYACLNWQNNATCVKAPLVISSCVDLQKIGNDSAYPMDGNYILTQNIDCTETSGWNSGAGFEPIGNYSAGSLPSTWVPFTGKIDFQGYKISGLVINRSTEEAVGLFAYLNGAEIIKANLSNINITGGTKVGGLVGYNSNTLINNAIVSGTVKSTSGYVGGLIGDNYNGNISNCSATITIALSGGNNIGGLIGQSTGNSNISNCLSSGQVNGSLSSSGGVGGLIGKFDGNSTSLISNSTSTATVTANVYGGGLIGYCLNGSVSYSSASGPVKGHQPGYGGSHMGGLVGLCTNCSINNSNASGEIVGTKNLGGLVGTTNAFSRINDSYATGKVSGGLNLGGLVGDNVCPIGSSFASGEVNQNLSFIPASMIGRIGGLVGAHSNYSIENCYALGNVNGLYAGGLVGYTGAPSSSSINKSYSKGLVTGSVSGGFIGWNYGNFPLADDYWDTQASGQAGACGAGTCTLGIYGRTTNIMKTEANYVGWDFSNIWTITSGSTYPCLKWYKNSGGTCPSS